ncbi:MAG: YraN family protein [Eggerthellaceae bacterium]|jgi:putative endonuclease
MSATETKKKEVSETKDAPVKTMDTQAKTKPKNSRNTDLGQRGEEAAVRFLQRRGYEILERNWKCRAGEADIIAKDGTSLVFVEVKTRSNIDYGLPSEAVDDKKRSKYERIAMHFLKNFDEVDIPVRFDVISLVVVAKDRALIRHHINAFAEG